MTSTLFVAIYKFLDACRGWFRERCETVRARIVGMFAIVFAMAVAIRLTLFLCGEDDSQTDAVEPPTAVEATDDCYTDDTDTGAPRGVNRYAVALLRGTANAGELDEYDHCKHLSVIVPTGEFE